MFVCVRVFVCVCVYISERVSLSDVSHLVIDEADTLFDATFDEEMRRIFEDIAVRVIC